MKSITITLKGKEVELNNTAIKLCVDENPELPLRASLVPFVKEESERLSEEELICFLKEIQKTNQSVILFCPLNQLHRLLKTTEENVTRDYCLEL